MKNSTWMVLTVLIIAGVGGLYWFLHQPPEPESAPPPPAAAPAAPPAAPAPPTHYPVEEAPAATPPKPLPSLEDSDSEGATALMEIFVGSIAIFCSVLVVIVMDCVRSSKSIS